MERLNDEVLDRLFREARTHCAGRTGRWATTPCASSTTGEVGPTASNAGPARFVFLRSREAKERLRR